MNETTETQAAEQEQAETQKKLEEIERKQAELQEQIAAGAMLSTRSKAEKISPTHKRLQTAASAAAKNPNRTQLMHYMKLKRNGFQN